MKEKFIILIFTIFILASGVFAQTSWLDRPLRDWNTSSSVPKAPRLTGEDPNRSNCSNSVRRPESIVDRAVTRAGWSLFGAAQIYGSVTLVNGMASVDGMCRPMQFNTFIFVRNRFAGMLSPVVMDSRTDGVLTDAVLVDQTNITAEFARYTSNDALCCPSQKSAVSYRIFRSRVRVQNVSTSVNCQNQADEPPTVANKVTGTVTYRQRIALPRNAVLKVQLEDITNKNTTPKIVAEKRIRLNGRQVPLSFEIEAREREINPRNDYAIYVEILSGRRILYTNEAVTQVLTKGNPSRVNIVVSPADIQDDSNERILRGTVTYRERIALPSDAEIKVKLFDVSSGNNRSRVLAEDNFRPNGRQVPFPFELRFRSSQIRSSGRYVVRAEIFTDGKLAFKTDEDYAVLTQGNPSSNVSIFLVRATIADDTEIVTGKEINISKFGTGSFSIEDRSSALLVRVRVKVNRNGKADVTLSPIGPAITFSGDLIYSDNNTLRIAVKNSGNADASGEIEVKYSGRKLNSVKSRNLVLDNQKASINF